MKSEAIQFVFWFALLPFVIIGFCYCIMWTGLGIGFYWAKGIFEDFIK